MAEDKHIYPILEYDDADSMISPNPREALQRDLAGVDTAVMTYFPNLQNDPISEPFDLLFNFVGAATYAPQYLYQDQFVIANVPLGGPAATALMEELISIGITRFISLGSAGLLKKDFDQRKLLLVTEAIRDEGVSYQYLPAKDVAYTNALLRAQYADCLRDLKVPFEEGMIWSTDAIYRETRSRVIRREQMGAIAVDMECASLCAVAQRRGVAFAHAAYFSDTLSTDMWSGFVPSYDALRRRSLEILLSVGETLSMGF